MRLKPNIPTLHYSNIPRKFLWEVRYESLTHALVEFSR
jgi:hypothetical protein